ncbi:MAG TPA: hypothetical protein DCO83_04475 [Mucilaginibacter sp.]|jgi:hypothetical protein|nr:hypothetical protein [Mucilaginibacter sp.]
MHREIEDILINLDFEYPFPSPAAMQNAERILDYMDDIYVERTGKFEYTPAESLYIIWNVEDLEFHIECLKNGRILYTFRKNGIGKAFGTDTIWHFIMRMESYLLSGIC